VIIFCVIDIVDEVIYNRLSIANRKQRNNMYKNILFDLDGTLLPLDEELFLKKYISLLGKKFYELGLNPQLMIERLWAGTSAMVKNDGKQSNEDVFWNIFYPDKDKQEDLKKRLEGFYQNEFDGVYESTKPSIFSKKIIEGLKKQGKRIFLLTNPIFPLVATKKRIEWAGLNIDDFEFVTTYENSAFAKPNVSYYQDVINRFNLDTSETLMVGNDVFEDMIVEKLDIDTFLVNECLKNTENLPYDHFNQGSLEDFYRKYILMIDKQ